jgi:hypothetical protein
LNDKVKYWLELSEYDFETVEAMLSSKRYGMLDLCATKPLKKY